MVFIPSVFTPIHLLLLRTQTYVTCCHVVPHVLLLRTDVQMVRIPTVFVGALSFMINLVYYTRIMQEKECRDSVNSFRFKSNDYTDLSISLTILTTLPQPAATFFKYSLVYKTMDHMLLLHVISLSVLAVAVVRHVRSARFCTCG